MAGQMALLAKVIQQTHVAQQLVGGGWQRFTGARAWQGIALHQQHAASPRQIQRCRAASRTGAKDQHVD